MKQISLPDELKTALAALPSPKSPRSLRVLVPTMGALHEGHLTLVRRAREIAGHSGTVILSLFVNPTQFDKAEDLEKYPRTLENDLKLCRDNGVDLVFLPEADAMYQPNHSVTVIESALTSQLCGATRPGHFDGVCTVVLKLLNLTRPDATVFGKKDYQQLAIIRRMIRDLDVPVSIEGVETVREESGLALSSRNIRLTKSQHDDAPRIRRALLDAQAAYQNSETSTQELLAVARKEIESSHEGARIDYLELLDAENLQAIDQVTSPAVMATAVFYDQVRLIDNIELG